MKGNTCAFVILGLLAQQGLAQASISKNNPYLKMGKVKISHRATEVQSDEFPELPYQGRMKLFDRSPQLGEDPLSIVDILIKVWDIVQKNRPVANVESKNASALPVGAKNNWTELTGWMPTHSIQLNLEVENLYGMKVVDLEYQVKVMAGGNLNGKGQYIASGRVVPTKVSVLWAYNLDVNVDVISVTNRGTKENPLAAIDLDVKYTYGNMIRQSSGAQSYELLGDGTIRDLKNNQDYFNPRLMK